MSKFSIITTTLILVLCLLFVSGCQKPPNMKDLKLNNDSKLYAGLKEVCESPYVKFDCMKGLKCTLITSQPHIIKVCLPEGYKLEEDFTYRTIDENGIIINKNIKNVTEINN